MRAIKDGRFVCGQIVTLYCVCIYKRIYTQITDYTFIILAGGSELFGHSVINLQVG